MPKEKLGLPLATINITPLVDVLLVLSAILILIIPVTLQTITVSLPSSSTAKAPLEKTAIRLVLLTSGKLTVNDKEIEKEQLIPALQGLGPDLKNLDVELLADKEVTYKQLIPLLDLLQEHKITKIALVAYPIN